MFSKASKDGFSQAMRLIALARTSHAPSPSSNKTSIYCIRQTGRFLLCNARPLFKRFSSVVLFGYSIRADTRSGLHIKSARGEEGNPTIVNEKVISL
jgi:hypothetical protein